MTLTLIPRAEWPMHNARCNNMHPRLVLLASDLGKPRRTTWCSLSRARSAARRVARQRGSGPPTPRNVRRPDVRAPDRAPGADPAPAPPEGDRHLRQLARQDRVGNVDRGDLLLGEPVPPALLL